MTVQTIDVLHGMDASQTSALMGIAERVRLSAGDVLFRLGDDAEWLYSIVWGRVSLSLPMHVRQREQDIPVEERRPGQTFGWSAVIPPHRVTLTAVALAETELLAMPREPLLQLLEARPDIGYRLTRNVAAVMGHRLQVLQTMWLREMQRFVSVAHG